jgi:hypothetical protein
MKDKLKKGNLANERATNLPRRKEQAPGAPYDGTKIYVPGQLKSDYSGHIMRVNG